MTEQALCNAMRLHGDTVYRLALCRMQNTADAEDVYQDVFLKLLGQESGNWDPEHLKAWLIRATLNRCADIHRFRQVQKRGMTDDFSWDASAGAYESLYQHITGQTRSTK